MKRSPLTWRGNRRQQISLAAGAVPWWVALSICPIPVAYASPLCATANMTWSTQPDVHSKLQCRQRRPSRGHSQYVAETWWSLYMSFFIFEIGLYERTESLIAILRSSIENEIITSAWFEMRLLRTPESTVIGNIWPNGQHLSWSCTIIWAT